jgi:hypothetical protein
MAPTPNGEVTAWREAADGDVTIEAIDPFTRLNQSIGQWVPGDYGQQPGPRLDDIADLIAYAGVRRFDIGDVTLHHFQTTATPLEEMQAVARSDGGVLFADADGTLVYRDRTWPGGRDDQVAVPTFSDNLCAADAAVVWELTITTDDDAIVNRAQLTNVAGSTVIAHNADSYVLHGPHVLTRTNDQWITDAEGMTLAEYLVGRQADAYARIEGFTLHLIDPTQDLWRHGIDLRLGDLIRFVRETPSGGVVDLTLIVQAIVHEITPIAWVVTVATTRAVGNNITLQWDGAPFAWDDADPVNAWGY